MSGKHIELFLVNGVAGELTTAEIAGWTGHVLVGPRSDLPALLQRPELDRNGTYILLGPDEQAIDGVRVYIGKTENFKARIQAHSTDLSKDFFNRAVVISAKDEVFNEGHWGYLEAKLVAAAQRAQRCTLENTQAPQERRLSEAQRSDMEAFFEQIKVILPVLGINILRTRQQAENTQQAETNAHSPIFTLTLKKTGITAKAQVVDGEFLLLEGSQVVSTNQGSARASYEGIARRRAQLEREGSIIPQGDHAVTTRDIPCTSSSQAGGIVTGRSSNGRQEWRWANNGIDSPYAAWEDRGIVEGEETND